MALAYRTSGQKQAVSFKDPNDKIIWESGGGPNYVRAWIAVFNQISVDVTGRGAVVTSWFRDDHTRHRGGTAVDFRRLSGANTSMSRPYTEDEVYAIEQKAAAAGLPIYEVAPDKDINHWHLGPITRKAA